jgi:hypothetical protein
MALVMDVDHIKIIMLRAIETTGTLIVSLADTEGMQELQSNKFKANELLF